MLLMGLLISNAAIAEDKKGAILEFSKEKEQLGKISMSDLEPVKLDVKFTNEGDEPLVLSHVRGCCGTRIKEYPQKPILPGEEGVIKVEFRLAPRPHKVSRVVTVTCNDTNNKTKMYRIYGEVVEETTAFGSEENKAMVPENQ